MACKLFGLPLAYLQDGPMRCHSHMLAPRNKQIAKCRKCIFMPDIPQGAGTVLVVSAEAFRILLDVLDEGWNGPPVSGPADGLDDKVTGQFVDPLHVYEEEGEGCLVPGRPKESDGSVEPNTKEASRFQFFFIEMEREASFPSSTFTSRVASA